MSKLLHISSLLLLSVSVDLILCQNITGEDVEGKFITVCQTPNDRSGYCVQIHKCKIFMKAIEERNNDTFPFIKASRCGPANEDPLKPNVCCGEDINFISTERECLTPNGESARCIPILSCTVFLQALSTVDDKTKAFLSASVCQPLPDLMVCCGSDTTYHNQLTAKQLLPDRNLCGIQEDTFKVFGGENAGILEYPWSAALQYRNQTGHLSFKCGGTLISNKYVITAAHCLGNPSLTLHRVRLGEWNLDTPDDCIGTGQFRQCTNRPVDAEVQKVIIHNKYIKSEKGVFYDIALLRLKNPVTYSSSIRPICLPRADERTLVGELVYVTGWGTTEYSNYSPIKQKLGVSIMDSSKCIELFGKAGYLIDDNHVCAGGEQLKDSCKGDSGGPLIATVVSNPNQFYLEGIVSYGAKRCGTEGVPGIYTRVNKYLDWIKTNISP